jgi:hypothetical protein
MNAKDGYPAGAEQAALRLAKSGGAVGPGIQPHVLQRMMLSEQPPQARQHDSLVNGLRDDVIGTSLKGSDTRSAGILG